jgi:hypothetical protein
MPPVPPIDPKIVHRDIANGLRNLANLFDLLGNDNVVKSIGEHLAATGITAEQVDACKSPEVAAKDKVTRKSKKETVTTPEPAKVEAAPALTPEQIAADVKTKLVALVSKDRAKAIAILASVGAKKFSDIPADKTAEVLLAVTKALEAAAPAAAANDDPLS